MPGVKGRSGRKPLPTRLKALRGTLRKHRQNSDEPEAVLGAPPCPGDFDSTQRRWWKLLTKQLAAEQRLAVVEEGTIAAYVIARVRVARANKHVNEEGAVYERTITRTTRGGDEVTETVRERNPWASELNQAKLVLRQLAVELGITSSSRSRVKAPAKPDEKDDARARLRAEFGAA